MKIMTLVLILVFIIGCGNSGSSGSTSAATTVEGADYSGSYRLAGVECYNSSLSTLTASATLGSGSSTGTLTITGNTLKSKSTSQTGCISTTNAKIVFTAKSSTIGTVAITGQSTTTSTEASCPYTYSLSAVSGGTITPSSFSTSVTHNGTPSDVNADYVRNSSNSAVGLLSVLQVSGSSSDLCFLVYQKL